MHPQLTGVIFSSIHLIIHVHGKFLKKPVAELEAEVGIGFVRTHGPHCQQAQFARCHMMWETACFPYATQPPQSQNWKLG